jgi:hypothetical protein
MKNRTLDVLSAGIALLCCAVPSFAGTVPVVPEPTTVLLMGGGLGAILVIRHLRSKKK